MSGDPVSVPDLEPGDVPLLGHLQQGALPRLAQRDRVRHVADYQAQQHLGVQIEYLIKHLINII